MSSFRIDFPARFSTLFLIARFDSNIELVCLREFEFKIMEKTNIKEVILENGHKVTVETSTRSESSGETSTFISINTGYVRIRIIQRISLNDLMPRQAKIGVSIATETDDLSKIETLALSLIEAVKIAGQLNEKLP